MRKIIFLFLFFGWVNSVAFSQKQKSVESTQIPYTIADRDLMREMLITMRLGFENVNTRLDAMEKRIDDMGKGMQPKQEVSEKSMSFKQKLIIVLLAATFTLSLIINLGFFIVSVKKRERQLAEEEAYLKYTQEFNSIEGILQRLERLEKQSLSLNS